MWFLHSLKTKLTVGKTEINVEDDIFAGYLVVYKDEAEAQKAADKLGCGITNIYYLDK